MIFLLLQLKVIKRTLLLWQIQISWWFAISWRTLICTGRLARLQVFQAKHNTLIVGHFGFSKTIKSMFCDYWWPQLWKFVKEFASSCDVCVCAKNPRHCPHGLLQPLLVLVSPWFSISMNFIVDLPRFNSFDSILMVVDHLMKMVHFIPCNKSITSKKIIKLVLVHENIVFLLWTPICIQVLEVTFWAIKCEGEVIINLPSWTNGQNKVNQSILGAISTMYD
jgi:hypothetical protein